MSINPLCPPSCLLLVFAGAYVLTTETGGPSGETASSIGWRSRERMTVIMPGKRELPSSLESSPPKAKRIWTKTHAMEQYGEGTRAHRTAFAALEHGSEKKDGTWVKRDRLQAPPLRPLQAPLGRSGWAKVKPSVASMTTETRKRELCQRAKQLEITGRTKMSKKELARAIARKR